MQRFIVSMALAFLLEQLRCSPVARADVRSGSAMSTKRRG
jgi:hypothetical protein